MENVGGDVDVKIKNIHFDSRRIVDDYNHLFIAFKLLMTMWPLILIFIKEELNNF